MQYSMPSLIASGVSPFHQMGAGSDTATVIWPGLKGLAMGCEPFGPTTSQLPILSAARLGTDSPNVAARATATRSRLLYGMGFLLVGTTTPWDQSEGKSEECRLKFSFEPLCCRCAGARRCGN